MGQVFFTVDFTGGMPFEGHQHLVIGNALPVVRNLDPLDAAAGYLHRYPVTAGIYSVLHQFLYNRSRPFDYLAGGDLVDQMVIQQPDCHVYSTVSVLRPVFMLRYTS